MQLLLVLDHQEELKLQEIHLVLIQHLIQQVEEQVDIFQHQHQEDLELEVKLQILLVVQEMLVDILQ